MTEITDKRLTDVLKELRDEGYTVNQVKQAVEEGFAFTVEDELKELPAGTVVRVESGSGRIWVGFIAEPFVVNGWDDHYDNHFNRIIEFDQVKSYEVLEPKPSEPTIESLFGNKRSGATDD